MLVRAGQRPRPSTEHAGCRSPWEGQRDLRPVEIDRRFRMPHSQPRPGDASDTMHRRAAPPVPNRTVFPIGPRLPHHPISVHRTECPVPLMGIFVAKPSYEKRPSPDASDLQRG